MKVKLDFENWNRREHFEFFKEFDEPFYNLNMDIECSEGYEIVKARNGSLFIWYLYNAMKASNAVKEFKYRIEGNDVVLSCEVIANPVAARFAWADNPEDAYLFNKEGFPAMPFRTDSWKGVTEAAIFKID